MKTDQIPKNVLPDLIIPVMAFGFAIYYLTTITEVPWIAQASAVLVSGLLLLAILAYAIRTILRLRKGTEIVTFAGLSPVPRLLFKRVSLLGLAIAYVYFIDLLGFTLSTLVFLFLAIMLLSGLGNWRRALAVAVASSLIGCLVFIVVFETRFPKGPVETFISDVRHGR